MSANASELSGVPGGGALADRLLAFAQRGLAGQALVYGTISAFALAVDLAVFVGLAHAGAKAALAGVAGYGAGLVIHFALSSRLAFDSAASGKSAARLFWQFAVSGLAGLVLTAAVIAFLADLLGVPALAAKAAAVAASFATVFILRRTLVFAPRR